MPPFAALGRRDIRRSWRSDAYKSIRYGGQSKKMSGVDSKCFEVVFMDVDGKYGSFPGFTA